MSHSVVPYFFLTLDNSIVTLGNTNISCDHTFITFSGFLIFFLTFDNFIVTLGSTNITSDSTFTFGPTTKVIFLLTYYIYVCSKKWLMKMAIPHWNGLKIHIGDHDKYMSKLMFCEQVILLNTLVYFTLTHANTLFICICHVK